jgi:DNA-binding SARP family transcriptional activator
MIETRDLVDFASDAAFAIDRGMEIIAWNHRAQQLLGYAPGEVIGRQCSEILQAVLAGGQPLCVPDCEAAQCFRGIQPFAASSIRALHKEGEWIEIGISSVVTPGPRQTIHAKSTYAIFFLRGEEENVGQNPLGRTLQIFTLGPFGMAVGGHGLSVEKWQRKQAITLLKYLVLHLGHAVPREVLIDCLWPDIDEVHGRERLKVTVYFLRRQLRAADLHEDILETVGKAYLLRQDKVWVSSQAFEKLFAEGSRLQGQKRWDKALRCYDEAQRLHRGEYMEEDIYADWCAAERERLHEVYLEILAGMSDCHAERGHHAEAAQVCRTALVRDPCRESFHYMLMKHLVRLGRAEQALAQFHRCERILACELGVEPMPETCHLYQQIVGEHSKARSAGNAAEGRSI